MGVFRFDNKYLAPTTDQRERYMMGESEEKHFGPEGQIVLIEYPDAVYLKDDIDNIRILYTGSKINIRPRKRQCGWRTFMSTRHRTKTCLRRHKRLEIRGRIANPND